MPRVSPTLKSDPLFQATFLGDSLQPCVVQMSIRDTATFCRGHLGAFLEGSWKANILRFDGFILFFGEILWDKRLFPRYFTSGEKVRTWKFMYSTRDVTSNQIEEKNATAILPEKTNSSPLRINVWKMNFLLGRPILRGELLNFRGVTAEPTDLIPAMEFVPNLHNWNFPTSTFPWMRISKLWVRKFGMRDFPQAKWADYDMCHDSFADIANGTC